MVFLNAKVCGNPKCKTSTGIHGLVTHGWGDLDNNGFWEHECEYCSRAESIHNERIRPVASGLKDVIKMLDELYDDLYPRHKKVVETIIDDVKLVFENLF